MGRWLSADPAGPVDGPNLYQYVSGNPLRMNDPTGTEEQVKGGYYDPEAGMCMIGTKPPEVQPQHALSAAKKLEKAGIEFGSVWNEGKQDQIRVNEKYWELKYNLIDQNTGKTVKSFSPNPTKDIKDVVNEWLEKNDPQHLLKPAVDTTLSIKSEEGASAALEDILKNSNNQYALECLMTTGVLQLLMRKEAFKGSDAEFDAIYSSFAVTSGHAAINIQIPGFKNQEGTGKFVDLLH